MIHFLILHLFPLLEMILLLLFPLPKMLSIPFLLLLTHLAKFYLWSVSQIRHHLPRKAHNQRNDEIDSRNNKHQKGICRAGGMLSKNWNYKGFRNKPEVKLGSDTESNNYNKPSFASRSLNCIANWKSQIHSRCVFHISSLSLMKKA